MAKCADCGQEMTEAESCTFDMIQDRKGVWHRRSSMHFGEPGGRCHDCGVRHGGIHHYGCDVERCPICGLQLISCECFGDRFQISQSREPKVKRR